MIETIIFVNGVYDVVCSLCILDVITLPYFSELHLKMIKEYNEMYERILGTLVLTFGLMRLSGEVRMAGMSYIMEALYFYNELFHDNIVIYRGMFVITTCLIMGSYCFIIEL